MAPGIALSALSSAEKPLRVLDPMMGSGTVLAMARAHGHYATGVDVDVRQTHRIKRGRGLAGKTGGERGE
jgi:tRNA G10  N-methylase Trm11